jgi:phage terminase large subunit
LFQKKEINLVVIFDSKYQKQPLSTYQKIQEVLQELLLKKKKESEVNVVS